MRKGLCTHWDCDQPATVGVCGFYGQSRPAYALIRLLSPTEQRGQHVCLEHSHHLLDQFLMAQTEAPGG